MTQEDFDALVAELIIPQEKPRSTKNSYFRKCGEKRRLNKNFSSKKLKFAAEDFYRRYIKREFSGETDRYMIIMGTDNFHFCRYNSFTGRLKKMMDCETRKDRRLKRSIKRTSRRLVRRFKNKIADGSAYKKICKIIKKKF